MKIPRPFWDKRGHHLRNNPFLTTGFKRDILGPPDAQARQALETSLSQPEVVGQKGLRSGEFSGLTTEGVSIDVIICV